MCTSQWYLPLSTPHLLTTPNHPRSQVAPPLLHHAVGYTTRVAAPGKRDNPFAVPMRKPALTLLSGASAAATQPTSGASPPAFGSRGRSAVQGFSCTAGRCARRSLTPRCQTSSSTTSDVDAVEGRAHGHERRLLQLSGANPNATPSPRRARAQDRKVVFSAVVSVVVVCALLERADGSALVGGGVRGPQPTYADPCLPMLTNANH